MTNSQLSRVLTGLFLLLSLTLTSSLHAQVLQGNVQSEARQPLIGAYVSLRRNDTHSHTDENGNFELRDVSRGDTLLFSYLGFEAKKVVVDNPAAPLNVRLTESTFDLGAVTVRNDARQLNVVTAIDTRINPVRNSQQILRRVPGLFIGQHAGGGKAEQIFLRGFDIDHGTDVAISVDGMPVNMVSHAHGQGYADLHFIIPETVDKIDFGKGPYYADQGNFNTAGYVDFRTKDRLDRSMVGFDVGSFNTFRGVALVNLIDTANQSAYVAAEYITTDGPFDASQNFYRNNFLGKYSGEMNNGLRFSLLASHFESEWDASGQIPVRAVERGLISRFGAIDDTEGGNTSRTNIALQLNKILPNSTFIKSNFYYSLYDFELFSNFTFFAEDPINGDQIRQVEDRRLFGFESSWNKISYLGDVQATFRAGVGLRADRSEGNELARTLNRRTTLSSIQRGNIDEQNLYSYVEANFDLGDLTIIPALRYDHLFFNYLDDLQTLYDPQSQNEGRLSPKLSLLYDAAEDVQLYLKGGMGFHSNDTRIVLENRPTISGALPAAYGADLGTIFKPGRRVVANLALWYLKLDQEFVYVGDAGIVEEGGETRRLGVDASIRYQPLDWLFVNSDFTYSYARALGEPEDADLIPLAPVYTFTFGLNAVKGNFVGGLNARYLGDRPANEDNSIVAEGYTILDANASYRFGNLTLGVDIENLLDSDWEETQFATESRLANEPEAIEEIHFTPGTPFFIRGIVRYSF